MRVLVTWGSKLGGTAGIAAIIAEELRARGIDVVAVAAAEGPAPVVFDAAIIGGALYANRWHRDARRYVERHAGDLARIPTWMFSSGPLDASSDAGEIAPTRQQRGLLGRIGGLGHMTSADASNRTPRASPRRRWRRSSRATGATRLRSMPGLDDRDVPRCVAVSAPLAGAPRERVTQIVRASAGCRAAWSLQPGTPC